MLKVIIAEDESRVLQLIKKLVQWAELDLVNVGEADNGMAAFDLIVSQEPDVVITDIRMPGMDGLELVRRTREKGLKARFILVSGHKQFEYAQNALHYGVEDYLVKPINKQELNDILRRIRDRYLEESGRLAQEHRIKSQLERNREKLHAQFVHSLIREPERLNFGDIGALCADYQLDFGGGYFQAFALKVDRKAQEVDESHLNEAAGKVPQVIKRSLRESCRELVIYHHQAHVVCLANFLDYDTLVSRLKTLLDEVRKQTEKHSFLVVTIGLGPVGSEPRSLVKSVQAALAALDSRVKLGADRIIDGAALRYQAVAVPEFFTPERQAQFGQLVEALDREALQRWLGEVFAEMTARADISPAIYVEVSRSIGENFRRLAGKLGLASETAAEADIASQIDNATSVAELQDLLADNMGRTLEAYLQLRRTQDARPIRLAKQYIQAHYQEPISLEQVAHEIHLNPVYFSVVFKKEAGVNFMDYLINCRVEKAKDLLKNTPGTVLEIAESVGYKDAKYFSKLFTKVVGITPGEFRKLYA